MTGIKETLYVNATIVTVNKTRDVYAKDGALLVRGNNIADIGKSSRLLHNHPDATIVDCKGQLMIPGLINTHVHLSQSLMRGLAEDLPLLQWLCDSIWHLEAAVEGEDGYDSARLTIAEMLKSGTTCFLEAMFSHNAGADNLVRAVDELGIRACLSKLIKPVDPEAVNGLSDVRDRHADNMSVNSALDVWRKHNGSSNGRTQIWFGVVTPRGVPIEQFAAIGKAARANDIGITMHCAEAPSDNPTYHEKYNRSPLEFVRDTQLAGPKTVLAHVVHPDHNPDFQIMKATGTTVSHNPSSNCKLGSGVCPVPDMVDAGTNVALGTDGAPCNNSYDMIREMHLASILHSGVRQKAGIINAYHALEMATINGARALGMENTIGSLEVGKRADFVLVRPNSLACAPFDPEQLVGEDAGGMDPVTVLVHSCSGADVESVVVDGRTVVKDFRLVIADEDEIRTRAIKAVLGLRRRAGIQARSHLHLNYQ